MAQSVDPTQSRAAWRFIGSDRSNDEASMRGTHQGQQSARTASTGRNMTASDTCTTRNMTSCTAGAIHT